MRKTPSRVTTHRLNWEIFKNLCWLNLLLLKILLIYAKI
jgi:hypothetical protein